MRERVEPKDVGREQRVPFVGEDVGGSQVEEGLHER